MICLFFFGRLFFQEGRISISFDFHEIVHSSGLVMSIVLDEDSGLSRFNSIFLHFLQQFLIDFNDIFTYDDTFRTIVLVNLFIPSALSNLVYFESCLRMCVEDTFEDFFALEGQYFRGFILTCHYLFVQFAGVSVFERQIPAKHGIEDDSTTPYISA